MITARFPRYRAICCDLNELELDRLPGWNSRNDEPVRIIRRQHRTHRAVPRRRPVSELNRVPGQKDVVTDLRWRGIIDSKHDRNEFGSQHRVLNAVRNLSA